MYDHLFTHKKSKQKHTAAIEAIRTATGWCCNQDYIRNELHIRSRQM